MKRVVSISSEQFPLLIHPHSTIDILLEVEASFLSIATILISSDGSEYPGLGQVNSKVAVDPAMVGEYSIPVELMPCGTKVRNNETRL